MPLVDEVHRVVHVIGGSSIRCLLVVMKYQWLSVWCLHLVILSCVADSLCRGSSVAAISSGRRHV